LATMMPVRQHSLLTGEPMDLEYRVRTRDGSWRWIRSRAQAFRGADGQIREWYGTAEDISELKGLRLAAEVAEVSAAAPVVSTATQPALEISILRTVENDPAAALASLLGSDWSGVRHIFESVANGISISDASDPEMPLIYVNPAFEHLTGYTLDEVRGRSCRFLQVGEREQPGLESLRRALNERRDVTTVLKNFKKDGTPFWNELHLSPIRDRGGKVTHYVGIQVDVTARVELEGKIAHMAHHDILTGLCNRGLLMDRLAQALSRAERSGRLVAVLFLDLDNLKTVNDTHGHDAGDLLLKVVGQRLGSAIRKYETAARLGGDEFVVVLEDIQDEQGASRIRDRIAGEVQQPIWISQETLHPSASIGMALYPQDGQTPGELLRVADVAMYAAKGASKQQGQAASNAAWLQ